MRVETVLDVPYRLVAVTLLLASLLVSSVLVVVFVGFNALEEEKEEPEPVQPHMAPFASEFLKLEDWFRSSVALKIQIYILKWD